MNRFISTMLICLSLLLPAGSFAQSYCTLSELREETKDGWQQDVENSRGEVVHVSANIAVPQAETFPVSTFEFVCLDKATTNDDSIWWDTMDEQYGEINLNKETAEGLIYYESRELLFSGQAENNPWSSDDAFNFAVEKIQSICPDAAYINAGALAYSRAYKTRNLSWDEYISLHRSSEALDYDSPLDSKGLYEIWLMPLLNGIPVHDTNIPRSYARIQDQDNFSIRCRVYKATGNKVENIPLCPWSKVKQAIEKEIKEGRLREIYSIRLCYLEMFNSMAAYQSWQKRGDVTRIACPMWIVHGAIFDDASSELNASYAVKEAWPDYHKEQVVLQNSSLYFLINPQTGEMLGSDWKESEFNDKTVVAPSYLGWDDVGKAPKED